MTSRSEIAARLERPQRLSAAQTAFCDGDSLMRHAEALHDFADQQAREIAELEAKVAGLERERDESLCLAEGPSTLLDLARGALERGSQLQAAEARIAELEAKVAGLREALEFYADPKVYEAHPHGPAFDRRDLSPIARAALTGTSDTGDAG